MSKRRDLRSVVNGYFEGARLGGAVAGRGFGNRIPSGGDARDSKSGRYLYPYAYGMEVS